MEIDKIKKHITKATEPIFNEFLQETNSNSRTTTKTTKNTIKYLWQPHNYRYKTPYNRQILNEIALHKVLLKLQPSNYKVNYCDHTKVWHIHTNIKGKNYTITLELGKRFITAIYSTDFWYLLEANRLQDINKLIDKRVSKIKTACIEALKIFSKKYGGRPYYNEGYFSRHEDGIKGDDYLDNIDPELIVHDTTFKKVYPDKVEFKSPVYMKRYINNRCLDMVAPEIKKSIDKNTSELKEWTKAVNLEIKNKQLHMKVLNDMSNTLKNIDNNLLRVKYKGRRLSRLERLLIK